MRRVHVPPDVRRAAAEATVVGGCVLFAGTVAATAWHVPAGPLLTLAAVAGFLTAVAVLINTGAIPLAAYTAAWAVLILGWLVYVETGGSPWRTWPLIGLCAACFALGPAGAFLFAAWKAEMAKAAAAELARLDVDERARYARIFAALGAPVRILDIGEDRTGRHVRLGLPDDGKVTLERLEQLAGPVETALRLKRRHMIRFAEGSHAGEVVMRINNRDVLAEPVPMPMIFTPWSVNRPLRVGLRETGEPYGALLREVHALAVGETGSGKSNLANVVIAQLARCVDCLVFVIDLKMGRMAAPWVMPWIMGKAPRPAVDWVATNRGEAHIMLSALQNGLDARAYSLIGGEKHIPTREHPGVVVLTDETAVLLGPGGPSPTPEQVIRREEVITNSQLAKLAGDIINRGRSEAHAMVLFTLRGTVDMVGNGNVKAQCGLRFGLQCQTEQEARYVIEDKVRISRLLAKMQHAGSGIVQWKKQPPEILKFDRLEYDDIEQAAIATAGLRPEPDAVLAGAWGDAWADRWVRAEEWRNHLRRTADVPDHLAPSQAHGAVTLVPPQRTQASWNEIIAAPELADLVNADAGIDERHVRMRELVIAHNDALGVSPKWLMTLLEEDHKQRGAPPPPAYAVLIRWLKADVQAGVLRKLRYGRYGRPR